MFYIFKNNEDGMVEEYEETEDESINVANTWFYPINSLMDYTKGYVSLFFYHFFSFFSQFESTTNQKRKKKVRIKKQKTKNIKLIF